MRKSNVAKHPRQVEHNIQYHEDVVGIVVVTGGYVDPASARKRAQYARRQQKAREGRRGGSAVTKVTKAKESKART